jgi:hypothetical protein
MDRGDSADLIRQERDPRRSVEQRPATLSRASPASQAARCSGMHPAPSTDTDDEQECTCASLY